MAVCIQALEASLLVAREMPLLESPCETPHSYQR